MIKIFKKIYSIFLLFFLYKIDVKKVVDKKNKTPEAISGFIIPGIVKKPFLPPFKPKLSNKQKIIIYKLERKKNLFSLNTIWKQLLYQNNNFPN